MRRGEGGRGSWRTTAPTPGPSPAGAARGRPVVRRRGRGARGGLRVVDAATTGGEGGPASLTTLFYLSDPSGNLLAQAAEEQGLTVTGLLRAPPRAPAGTAAADPALLAALARFDQAAAHHPLLPVLPHRARLDAARR